MTRKLKNILGLIALVFMFVSCSKDSELLCPADDQNYINSEKRYSPDADVSDDDNSTSGMPYGGSGVEGDVDGDGISDDDDDEDDDDGSSRNGDYR